MFYCDTCAEPRNWPLSMFKSQGRCEVCGAICVCNDVASTLLPLPPAYVTKSGKVLTEADIEELVREAERGYDVDQLRERGVRRANQGQPVCASCQVGDHRDHRPDLAGICIGCACEYAPHPYDLERWSCTDCGTTSHIHDESKHQRHG